MLSPLIILLYVLVFLLVVAVVLYVVRLVLATLEVPPKIGNLVYAIVILLLLIAGLQYVGVFGPAWRLR